MPQTAMRRWTFPLTALLLLNSALVASAFWRVGLGVGQSSAATVRPVVEQSLATEAVNQTAPTDADSGPDMGGPWEQPAPEVASITGVTSITGDSDERAVPGELPASGAEPEPWGEESMALPPPVLVEGEPAVSDRDAPPPSVTVTAPASAANAEPELPSTATTVAATVVDKDSVIVINPPATGGVVHFLVDTETVSLAPGELQRWPAQESFRVRFHRGEDFGDADQLCGPGVYVFAVSDGGWTLGVVEGPAAERLLKVCVSMTAEGMLGR